MTFVNPSPATRRRVTDFPSRIASMPGTGEYNDEMATSYADADQQEAGIGLPIIPRPLLAGASGTYEWTMQIPILPIHPLPTPIPFPFPGPTPTPFPLPPRPALGEQATTTEYGEEVERVNAAGAVGASAASVIVLRETLRVDVDGRWPQMVVSGTIYQFLTERTHWIARVTRQPDGSFAGPIFYTSGVIASFPYQQVRVLVQRSIFPAQRNATVEFRSPTGVARTRTYRWSSTYVHPCELEYDTVAGATAVTEINTAAHPTHPASLPGEILSIETVYRRSGFNVTRAGDSPIPVTNAGPDGRWSVTEMHDAMQRYWSKFANRPQWAVWTLFASLSDQGTSLGGIMFDDIGPNHRQGTAILSNSFISQAPAGDAAPAAWVERMRFWTAVHELGHTFNLAHSWQKVHPASWGNSWIPMANEPEARSFMNYPYNVSGGQSAFFASFEYRFSDQELLFMRHAPERFVQQGNANWFSNHGFEQLRVSEAPSLKFELRSNRMDAGTSHAATLSFLDQAVLEAKVTNVSSEPTLIDEHLLDSIDQLTLVVKREGGAAQVHTPFSQMCWHGARKVLMPGESLYASIYLSAGKGGFYVAEPGRYVVQAALHLSDEDVVSNVFNLRVLPPRNFEEAAFGQELFVSDVGRALAFDGTRVLTSANDVLREAMVQFPKHAIATHAGIALALPQSKVYKELGDGNGSGEGASRLAFHGQAPALDEASAMLHQALTERPVESAKILGHIDFADYAAQYVAMLNTGGDAKAAKNERSSVVHALGARGVKASILEQVKSKLG